MVPGRQPGAFSPGELKCCTCPLHTFKAEKYTTVIFLFHISVVNQTSFSTLCEKNYNDE